LLSHTDVAVKIVPLVIIVFSFNWLVTRFVIRKSKYYFHNKKTF
jgi:hypothetical protein